VFWRDTFAAFEVAHVRLRCSEQFGEVALRQAGVLPRLAKFLAGFDIPVVALICKLEKLAQRTRLGSALLRDDTFILSRGDN
jgi:hypothetical protein